jgi:ABC-type dipeptide/oligopeptide/nickel transport system permease component
MAGLIVRRLGSALPILLIVSLITFAMIHPVPGDPAARQPRPLTAAGPAGGVHHDATPAGEHMIDAPWIIAIPGTALMITVPGLNLLGDGLRGVLDPRVRGHLSRWRERACPGPDPGSARSVG